MRDRSAPGLLRQRTSPGTGTTGIGSVVVLSKVSTSNQKSPNITTIVGCKR